MLRSLTVSMSRSSVLEQAICRRRRRRDPDLGGLDSGSEGIVCHDSFTYSSSECCPIELCEQSNTRPAMLAHLNIQDFHLNASRRRYIANVQDFQDS